MPSRSDPRTDLAACAAMLRTGSLSFHAASRLLPRRVRDPATVLYAFCRIADDAVDLGTDKTDAVARLSTRLDLAYAGTPMAGPVDGAFATLISSHAIPRALPESLIEGLAWDAEGRTYATIADLRAYAARVAGTVGAMMAILMGVRDAETLAAACDLGLAMQLTNIARDVGEDARAGRLYLPLDWLAEADLDVSDILLTPTFTPALASLVERLLAEAETLYAAAARGIPRLPADCRPGIAAALRIYRAIGRQLAASNHDSISRRVRVSNPRKLALAGLALTDMLRPHRSRPLALCAETAFLVDATALPPRDIIGPGVRLIMLMDKLERMDIAKQRRSTPLSNLTGEFSCSR